MGMFDYVRCEFKLPHPSVQNADFQTKSTDCGMEMYRINIAGNLEKRHQVWKYTNKWKNDPLVAKLFKKKKYMRRQSVLVKETWDCFPYYGEFNFYTSGKNGLWYEYELSFIAGIGQKAVKVISPRKCIKCNKLRTFHHSKRLECEKCDPWCYEHTRYGCKKKVHHPQCKEHFKYDCKEKVHKETAHA